MCNEKSSRGVVEANSSVVVESEKRDRSNDVSDRQYVVISPFGPFYFWDGWR